ncbi:hypothetical protein Taro_044082 [Colocasia esculenta]|uniref:RING-type E3 ubiquitin transferase n=1 Tax=Colocasia esculenta TaxID=4460 RepID=A0A843WT27_COLES|nr:hypothetical protein [Colocasia esculenta]
MGRSCAVDRCALAETGVQNISSVLQLVRRRGISLCFVASLFSLPFLAVLKQRSVHRRFRLGTYMDMYSNKKVVGGVHFSRNGPGTGFLDNLEDRRLRFRNHQGCSTRVTSQVSNPERPKPSRLAFFSTGRKATVGGSSGVISRSGDKWKPQQERQDTTFLQERGTMRNISREEQIEDFESNIRQKGVVNLELDPTSEVIHTLSTVGEVPQSSVQGFSLNVNETAGNCPASSTRSRRPRHQVRGSSNQESSSSLPARYSVVPRTVNHNFRHTQNQVPSTRRYGLGNLSCTSISDVLPSGCSPDVGSSRGMDALRKIYSEGGGSSRSKGTVRALTGRNPDSGESSSARSKGTIRSLTGVDQDSHRTSPSSASSSILEHPLPQPTSKSARQTRNRLTSRDGGVLVRNQRAASGHDDTFLLPETIGVPPSSLSQLSLNEAAATSSHFSTSHPPIAHAFSGRLGSASRSSHTRRRAESEDNNIRGFCGPWMHRDGYPRLNMEGIAEEEYNVGDEVGKLQCDHRYHVTCIHQWLRQKNWCPICKSAACPS